MQSDREECASLCIRLDGARAAEGGSGVFAFLRTEALLPAGFHGPRGWSGEAQSGVGEGPTRLGLFLAATRRPKVIV
jgi:hypothetical protein